MPARRIAIVSHAMMVDRRTLDRGFLAELVANDIGVIAFDQRGHGSSRPRVHEGTSFGYDRLVEDVQAVIDWARAKFPTLPISLVGHSLFAHVSLAHLARHGTAQIASLVMIGCNVPTFRWSRFNRLRATILGFDLLSRIFGRFPARALRIGSEDEPSSYAGDFTRWVLKLKWTARDGFNYEDGIPRIDIPVLGVAGSRDWLAPATDFARLIETIPAHEFFVVDTDHMGLMLTPNQGWKKISEFLLRAGRQNL